MTYPKANTDRFGMVYVLKDIIGFLSAFCLMVMLCCSLPLWGGESSGTAKHHYGKLLYEVDYLMYFDNRESRIPYYKSQTILGARLSPEVGWNYGDSTVGSHSIVGGFSYIQPFGASWRDARILPTVYYRFDFKGFYASVGIMPWRKLITRTPGYLMSDSLSVYCPNIQGALFGYVSRAGFVEIFCDWRGMQSVSTREAFRIILSGQWQWRWLQLGGLAQMNHLANPAPPAPHTGVCDDITVHPYAGLDFSCMAPLDSLTLQTGLLAGYQRDRDARLANVSFGFYASFNVKWRYVGLENTLYVGQPLMILYDKYGAALNQGEPFYAHRLYNRTDLSVYIIRMPMADLAFSWTLHYVPGYRLAHRQQLTAHFSLDALMGYVRTKSSKTKVK